MYAVFLAQKIGDIDWNSDPLIVEIDNLTIFTQNITECISKRLWIFGGIERNTGSWFLTIETDRKEETLETKLKSGFILGLW